MSGLEIILAIAAGYVCLLLVLEFVLWQKQPDMEGVVTLHINYEGQIDKRKLFGFEHGGKLYVSSNHWFRRWYKAVLKSPDIEVERAGHLSAYTAVEVHGEERTDVARAYGSSFVLLLACGFAPRRFLRLDPRVNGPQQ